MKTSLTLLASLVLTGGSPSAPDNLELTWAPEEGLVLVRTFEASHDFALVEASLSVDDEVHASDEVPDWEVAYSERIVVTDTLVSVGNGRPLELRRTFDELESEVAYSGDDLEEDFAYTSMSDLQGRTVRFVRAEDEDDFEVEGYEEEIDEDLLDGLIEDMDLRAFLPDHEVEEGDTWEVSPAAYLAYMWPGGNLDFYMEDEGEVDETSAEIGELLYESMDGEATVTYAGTRDEDGVRVAVLELEIEVEAEAEVEVEEPAPGTQTIRLFRSVSGELLWNLEGGHLHSLHVDGEGGERTNYAFTVESPEGDEVEVEEGRAFEGEVSYSVTVEAD